MLPRLNAQSPSPTAFNPRICRLPGTSRPCLVHDIPLDDVTDQDALRRLLQSLRNTSSMFVLRVIDWTEVQDHLLVYTDGATYTPLEVLYHEMQFRGDNVPENDLWVMLYSMLTAVHDAQVLRYSIFRDVCHMGDPIPLLNLQAFFVDGVGMCRIDVLHYCCSYLCERGERGECGENETLTVQRQHKNLPPATWYLESQYKTSYPASMTDLLRLETYMAGMTLLLLCDPLTGMSAAEKEEGEETDRYYSPDQLYFRNYSIELSLIGYRLLYTQGNVRFMVADILKHDFMVIMRHLLHSSDTNYTHHTSDSGATPLMLAARGNFGAFESTLLGRYAGMIDGRGKTALMYAAENNTLYYVELLKDIEIQHQLRTVGAEDDGATALILAVSEGYWEVAALLLQEAGLARHDGRTALMLVCKNSDNVPADILDALIERERGRRDVVGHTALMHAAASGNRRCVEKLLPHEAGIHAEDGTVALLSAAAKNHASICSLLMEAEGSYTDNEGCTALIIAAKLGLERVATAAISLAGCSNNMGRTALMHAVKFGRQRIVSILCMDEREMGVTDRYGASALSIAAENGDTQLLTMLLSSPHAAKETSAVDKNGWTALIHAARNDKVECVRYLREVQAGIRDLKGYSAITYAVKWGHVDVVRELLDAEGHLLCEEPTASLISTLDLSYEMATLLENRVRR